MKKLLAILLFFASCNGAIAQNFHTSHYQLLPSGNYYNYPAKHGDSVVLVHGNTYGYFTIDSISGALDSDIVITNTGGQALMTNGISITDGSYWHIHGKDSLGLMGIKIVNPSGVGIDVTAGISNHFEADNFEIDSSFYFMWLKTEVAQYPCTPKYWWPTIDSDYLIHDFIENYCHQDGNYIGSTDEPPTRTNSCNGGAPFTARPMGYYGVHVWNGPIYNVQRTGIQESGCDNCSADSLDIEQCGFEFNSQQGAGIAFGYNDSNVVAKGNTISNTYIYNIYSYAHGTVDIENNSVDSASVVFGNQNSQQIPSILLSALQPNTNYTVKNNITGYNNASPFTNVVLYGDVANFTGTSTICNTGVFSNQTTGSPSVNTSCSVTSYNISATKSGAGTISPSGVTTVASGGSQAYVITATSPNTITQIKVDTSFITLPPGIVKTYTYTFSNVTQNHTIKAYFANTTGLYLGKIDLYNAQNVLVQSVAINPKKKAVYGIATMTDGSTFVIPCGYIITQPSTFLNDNILYTLTKK